MTKTLTSPPEIDVDQLPSAQPVESHFAEYVDQIQRIKTTAETLIVKDESDKLGMELAATTRKALKTIRCAIENRRVELGEASLRRTQRINDVAKQMIRMIEPLETRMLEQERFAVRAAEQRRAALKLEREAVIAPFLVSGGWFGDDLGTMQDVQFADLLVTYRGMHETRLARQKAEREEAEAKARAEAEAREALRLENERLRAEAIERERAAKEEREKAEALARIQERKAAAEFRRLDDERLAALEKARQERQASEAAARLALEKAEQERAAREAQAMADHQRIEAERKAEREAAEAVARKEREAREKVEAELRAKQAAEETKRKAEVAAARKAASAPDREKLLAYAESLAKQPRPEMTTDEGMRAMALCESDVLSLYRTIRKRAVDL